MMVMEIEGTEQNFKKGIAYLKGLNIDTEPIEQDIHRDEVKCVHCGVCTSVCAPDALHIENRKSMKVEFDYKKCVACELLCESLSRKGYERFFLIRTAREPSLTNRISVYLSSFAIRSILSKELC